MLSELRDRTGARRALAALAVLALALKIVFPPGFMPGTSAARPIILCSGQMPEMGAMEGGGHRQPAKMPQRDGDHPCPFGALGAAPLIPDQGAADAAGLPVARAVPAGGRPFVAPGRGMAAPPPPSHAPPARRA